MTNHTTVPNFCDFCLKKVVGNGGHLLKGECSLQIWLIQGLLNTVDSFWMRAHRMSSKYCTLHQMYIESY